MYYQQYRQDLINDNRDNFRANQLPGATRKKYDNNNDNKKG
jgi:hypothetical protein